MMTSFLLPLGRKNQYKCVAVQSEILSYSLTNSVGITPLSNLRIELYTSGSH